MVADFAYAIFQFTVELLVLLLVTLLYCTGEIILYLVTLGKRKPRWDILLGGRKDKQPKWQVLAVPALYIGVITWLFVCNMDKHGTFVTAPFHIDRTCMEVHRGRPNQGPSIWYRPA